MRLLAVVKIWLWISALATVAGWMLSALGQLNRAGYLIFGCAIAAVCILGRKTLSAELRGKVFDCRKVRWRFRHALPCGFALLAALVFVGGAIYPPTNHTAMTYRTPRVLQWLAHEHWFWIHTPNYRMNNRACGIEWLSAPWLLFTKSDRGLFLLNFIPFLLLPGLIYSLFIRLGVRGRVAWSWMWLIPSGYTFLLQAGSIGNDTFPTVYALAAVDFGLRAWASRRLSDLWFSLLAAALLTGAKASNLPLLLPWALLVIPLAPQLVRKPALSAGMLLLAATVSFLPTAVLNQIYCKDWSGLNLERSGMAMKYPIVGIWGNGLLLLLNNFVPPFFPQAGWWNQSALSILPHAVVAPMVANFESGFHMLAELPTEDWAGLGFGVSTLLLISIVGSLAYRPPNSNLNPNRFLFPLFLISPWVALLVYCAKSGMVTGARLISPYYPLLIPLLVIGAGHAEMVRRRWWRVLAGGTLLLCVPVLVMTPGRPLWPARTVLSWAQQRQIAPALVARALRVYIVYAGRSDPLANVRGLLPPKLKVVGFLADADDIDISLWRPFGERRVEHILLTDSGEQIRQRQVEYIVIGGGYLAANGINLADWLGQKGGHLVANTTATMKVSEGPQRWYVVKL